MDRDVHAYLIVEIVSVFKGWMDKNRSKCHMVKKGT